MLAIAIVLDPKSSALRKLRREPVVTDFFIYLKNRDVLMTIIVMLRFTQLLSRSQPIRITCKNYFKRQNTVTQKHVLYNVRSSSYKKANGP